LSLTRREIAEQPAALAGVLARAAELAPATQAIRGCDRVALVGRGSSGNAALYAEHLLGRYTDLAVSRLSPSLQSVYERPTRLDDAFLIATSQSGRSPDVVAVVEAAAAAGRPTLAITNDPASPLAAAADFVFDLGVGPEDAVAATKTYTASLAAFAMLAVGLLGEGDAPAVGASPASAGLSRAAAAAELALVPHAVAAVLSTQDDAAAELAERLGAAEHLMVTGRGPNLATAAEAALKITELTGTPTGAWSPAELQHGPVAALGPDSALLGLGFAGPALPSLREAFDAARARSARVAAITDQDDLVEFAAALRLDPIAEWLSPFPATVAAQLLAVALSERGAVETDTPFGLRKVTLTR
jgi:glutamine---fructose-6-phosphate transaminase (isomerizing)